jgi:cytochrome c biogenesis protein
VPQSVYQLEDRSQLRPIGDGATPVKLAEGETWELPGGGSLTFVETTEWATFQVTQDPGKLVALVAGTGMVVGLCLSLFVRRRRLWLRAAPAGDSSDADQGGSRTVVEVAGLARTGPEAFEAEFAELVERLRPTPARAPQEDPA